MRLGLDRRMLRTVPGLRFWRLLGTGAGSSTGPGADLHRTALFAIWDDEGSLEAFHVRNAPGFAVAVQWHPEWKVMSNPFSRALFAALGAASRERAQSR